MFLCRIAADVLVFVVFPVLAVVMAFGQRR